MSRAGREQPCAECGLISEPGVLPLLTDPATETIRLGAIVQVIGALTAIPMAAMLVAGGAVATHRDRHSST